MSKDTKQGYNRYYLKIYREERNAAGNSKHLTVMQDAYTPSAAIKGAITKLNNKGITDIKCIRLDSEGIPVSAFKKRKPPMHKTKAFYAIYDGLNVLHYKHVDTGQIITPEQYRSIGQNVEVGKHAPPIQFDDE
jgi:ribosomal protein S1